jgi:hydrogenase maturation protease
LPASPDNQAEKDTPPRVVIIGVGNLLMRDEGVGIHTVQALQSLDLPPHVELIDGGTSPDLIAYTGAGEKVVIIDAAKAGSKPGTIYRFKPEDLASEKRELSSSHEMGVLENLQLLALTGREPAEMVIIGIEPVEISPGLELSPVLRQKMPEIVRVVLKEIGITPDAH